MNNLYADEVDGYLEEWLADYTKAELLEIALEHRIPLAPVRTYEEVRTTRRWPTCSWRSTVATPGPWAFPGVPYRLADAESQRASPAPTLGQHNREVLCEGWGTPGKSW